MRLAVIASFVAGCSFHHGELTSVDGDGGADGRSSDGRPDACVSFSSHLDTCTEAVAPGGPLVLTGSNTYNTDDFSLDTPSGAVTVPHDVLTMSTGDQIVVILVPSFSLSTGAQLRTHRE